MSSLQKFHRRTQSLGPIGPFTTIGSGNGTVGYWLGDIATNRLVVAPKSTEASLTWGSYGTVRGTNSTTDGLANTNTLAGFGQAAHPAAYYCKTLTQGGYNTWYLPAKDELNTLYSNKSATPFATANAFGISAHWSSTENNLNAVAVQRFESGGQYGGAKNSSYLFRAVRRSTI